MWYRAVAEPTNPDYTESPVGQMPMLHITCARGRSPRPRYNNLQYSSKDGETTAQVLPGHCEPVRVHGFLRHQGESPPPPHQYTSSIPSQSNRPLQRYLMALRSRSCLSSADHFMNAQAFAYIQSMRHHLRSRLSRRHHEGVRQ